MSFLVTLWAVVSMLLYALPGYLLVKTKLLKQEAIPNFSKLLLYVCQPCLTFYSLSKISFSSESALNLGLCFLLTFLLQGGLMLFYFLIFKKKRKDVSYRIVNVAAVFSNCGYLGVPLLEKLLPDHPEVAAYSCIFALSMHMLGWSAGLYIISLDRAYISAKKIFLNPATVALAIALPFYFFSLSLPNNLSDMVSLLAKMSTPLCMLIMGMRLSTMGIKNVFFTRLPYLSVLLNQIVFPLLAFILLLPLPIDPPLKSAIIILSACPVASIVQNYTELLGIGQRTAAGTVLLGTLLSCVTVPLICLLL